VTPSPDSGLLVELPLGLPGRVFRSPMPFGSFDPEGQVLRLYEQAGVRVVIVLAEGDEIAKKTGRDLLNDYATHNIEAVHLPFRDFSVPALTVLRQAVETVWSHAREGQNVAVHCNAGIGRTGMVMACLARQELGFSAVEAINWVRQYIPGAVETAEQVRVVEDYTGK
jgi:hypothetical protein